MAMQAGTYYVGDLSFVTTDEQWDAIFNDTTTLRCANYETYWGDGIYYDNNGRRYGVDTGTIGCILVTDITRSDAQLSLGHIVTYDKPFKTCAENGTLRFGRVWIYTHTPNPFEID